MVRNTRARTHALDGRIYGVCVCTMGRKCTMSSTMIDGLFKRVSETFTVALNMSLKVAFKAVVDLTH